MSHPYPLPIGVLLNNQYRIQHVIGSGGFGITYLAEDIHLRELFAVKEYFPNGSAVRYADNSLNIHKDDKASFQDGLHYFYNEARKAKKLNQPNIVQISALFKENNTAYLVMPYLHGETLRAWLKRYPQPVLADLQNIFLPLLDALAYMHHAKIEFYDERKRQNVNTTGILHLDIKPDNILLAQTPTGQTPMLIDFGAARHSTKSHGYAFRSNSFPQFTPNYAAGEHGTPRISPATDIYSLSACLYEAVSGYIPDRAAARIGKDDRLAACSDYCRRYPKAWLKVIDKGFDLNQQNRYQSADEMRQALAAASGQRTRKPNTTTTIPPKSSKGRLLALWAGIGAGAALGWGIYQYDGASDEPYPEPAPPHASAAAYPDAAALLAKEIAAEAASKVAAETAPAAPDAAEIKSLYKQAKDGNTQARERLQKLAEQGIAEAQNWLGEIYYYGYGVDKDYEQAVAWYRKAAEQGEASAQNNLGVMYKKGNGVDKDDEQAVKWFRKAAEQGEALAQNNLGLMYKNGYGVAQDYGQAVEWFRKAAEQGNTSGQGNLGVMYKNGYGVAQDDEQAVEWFRKAAEQGDARGQFSLGVMYEHGKGVAQDREQAVYWYRQVARQNDEKMVKEFAQRALKRLQAD